jgi:L-iditol 2-dehydrogenase
MGGAGAASMRAAAVRGRASLEIESRPRPEPESHKVRVRLLACGICGSDLHLHHGGLWPPGHVPGHEMLGEVDLLGEGASGISVGARVAIEPLEACGACDLCRAGRYNICPSARLHGIHLPGGLAEYVTVPAERCHPVPSALDPAVAALAEPMAVVVHGARRAGLAPGQRVLVLGAGTVGLLAVVAARALGAGEVWITARHPHQAELGATLGASRVLREDEADPLAISGLGAEAPIDCVIETVGGSADTLKVACSAIRPGGTVSVLGMFLADVAVPPLPLLVKEGTLAWSNCYGRLGARTEFEEAIGILSAQAEQLALLTTHRVPLDEVGRGFEIAADKASGAVKVTVRCT